MLEKAAENHRAELMSGASTLPTSPSDTRRRFQPTNSSTSTLHPGLRPQGETVSESPFRAAGTMQQGGLGNRESYALDEHTFIQNTENRLDDFIAQGREVLDNLVDQRHMLKGTQRKLLDTANTLGLSRNVISWIEKRRFVSLMYLDILLISS
jgi:Golgi SNAP receptor complex protein 2